MPETGSGTTHRSEKFTLRELLLLATELQEAEGGFTQSASLEPYFEDVEQVQAMLAMLLGEEVAAATVNGLVYGFKLAEQRMAPPVVG